MGKKLAGDCSDREFRGSWVLPNVFVPVPIYSAAILLIDERVINERQISEFLDFWQIGIATFSAANWITSGNWVSVENSWHFEPTQLITPRSNPSGSSPMGKKDEAEKNGAELTLRQSPVQFQLDTKPPAYLMRLTTEMASVLIGFARWDGFVRA